ncbi:MAG: hypothetical protein WCV56_04635 [Candidatus Omnitrophota bacterium]
MWTKWLPWRWVISGLARKHGFIDPMGLMAALNRIAQPSEVAAPVELLRLAAILHARGLINSQIIQNNLDWVWPYWVEQQFDPNKKAFVPRAFSLTHINLTHRNWTAVGVPGVDAMPIVDPRGLTTPLFDGWSIDAWLITESGEAVVPSRTDDSRQRLEMMDNLSVMTDVKSGLNYLTSRVEVKTEKDVSVCRMGIFGNTACKGRLVVSLRPFNPEGISFIHKIEKISQGWMINGKDQIWIKDIPSGSMFSDYRRGDVFNQLDRINLEDPEEQVKCDVGLCTGAMVFNIEEPGKEKAVTLDIPLRIKKSRKDSVSKLPPEKWYEAVSPAARLEVPDEKFKYLYDSSIRNLILMSPGNVYAGPYTYKEFWFRDAVYALNAMLCVNLRERAAKVIDMFLTAQSPVGYFKSQDGEWDSNGQVLWIMKRYCELTGDSTGTDWKKPILKAVNWISKKRTSREKRSGHSGLFPAGFSAEHFGPSDYYYWDDFWGVAGLDAAMRLLNSEEVKTSPIDLAAEKNSFLRSINDSIQNAQKKQGISTVPSSPYRRMDSSAVGIAVASYPLQIYGPRDRNIIDTVNYLIENDFINGLFFHEIAHSGINIYLSLHIAQVLLRAGNAGYFAIMEKAAEAASGTGQWPEAIHPWTGGGCMGDGQHLWASAEWIMMIRNCFIREEEDTLILCSGIPQKWIDAGREMFFGPAPTPFGTIDIRVNPGREKIRVEVNLGDSVPRPRVEIRLPGCKVTGLGPGQMYADILRGEK